MKLQTCLERENQNTATKKQKDIKQEKQDTDDTQKERCPSDDGDMPMLINDDDDNEASQKISTFKKPTNIPKTSHHHPKSFSTKPILHS